MKVLRNFVVSFSLTYVLLHTDGPVNQVSLQRGLFYIYIYIEREREREREKMSTAGSATTQ